MKMYFVEKFSEGDTDLQLEAMRKVFEMTDLASADFIYCASISVMTQAQQAQRNSGKPLVVYCWDYYLWAHQGKHESHNWGKYREFLLEAKLVIVPSAAQALRLKELLGIDAEVVKSGIPTYSHETSDGGFILDPLRYYPEENRDWAVLAANRLGIPIIHSEHQYGTEEFRKLVASCTFMTSCYREASTGALTLMEGLWLGKPSLVSDSPYQGARDYVGPYGTYFRHDDFEDLVSKMKEMWEWRSFFDIMNTREYMRKEFTYDAMAKNLHEAIHRHI